MAEKIVFATNNAHKLQELRQIAGPALTILSLNDIDCHDDIPEDADTLQGNAIAKALWVSSKYGYRCFADDTGLEVDALDGAPGVHSARFAPGDGHDSQANMRLLLEKMQNVPTADRTARFRTVIALIDPKDPDSVECFEGIVEGHITTEAHGDSGFGYDPVFRPTGWDKTFGEASPQEKNAISHRARATAKLMKRLLNR